MFMFEISSNIKYVYESITKIKIKLLNIILQWFFNVNSFLRFKEMNVMFVKNNIANSANAPRLNEYLQSSIRHDFLNKSDVEMNKLFCKTMIIKYMNILPIRNNKLFNVLLSFRLIDLYSFWLKITSDFIKIINNRIPMM